jgi:predicted pyridoxine 5'-phosphate oxidase superfamily flavin-nucleotide-binding protein
MTDPTPKTPPADVIFTPAMRAEQARLGSREMVARLEARGRWSDEITPDLAAFVATRDSLYIATASAEGRPYIQHRGGPAGFVRVIGRTRLAFAEERGNRQYMSFGNLSENDRVALFLMDYPGRQRIKIWGRGRVAERAPAGAPEPWPELWAALPEGATRAIVVDVEAWDANCPQFITPRYTEAEVAGATAALRARLAAAEAEVLRLRARLAGT